MNDAVHCGRQRCLSLALAAPGMALRRAKEIELEARVAQRSADPGLLQRSSRQESLARPDPAGRGQVARRPAGPVQADPGNPDAVFTYGGFIKLDAMATDTSDGMIAEGSAGRMFYVPSTIPVAADGAEPDTDPYTDVHAAFSRFWFAADHTTENGNKFRGFIEADLFGGGTSNLGNEVSTNTHGITIRHAYVTWNKWLAGQTWSTSRTSPAREAVDFVGVTEGTTFVARPRCATPAARGRWRWRTRRPRSAPSTAARNNAGGTTCCPTSPRYVMKGDWGHFGARPAAPAQVGRRKRHQRRGQPVRPVPPRRQRRHPLDGQLRLGHRPLPSPSAWARTPRLDANGRCTRASGGGFVAWRHAFSPKLRSNLMYSVAEFDNDRSLAGWGPASWAEVERAQSFHANLIYSPFPKLDVGAEVSWGQRELEDDRKGDLRRIQTTVKYTF